MASGFTFGFQTDDIDIDIDEDVPAVEEQGPESCQVQGGGDKEKMTLHETKRHGIDELVCLCLCFISFDFHCFWRSWYRVTLQT